MSETSSTYEMPRWLEGVAEIDYQDPIVLTQPSGLWAVLDGRIDLFMVRRLGESFGSRHHIARIGPGEVFFGIGPGVLTSGWTALAAAAPGTVLATIDKARLIAAAGSNAETTFEAHRSIERWIATLSFAVGGEIEPKLYLPLEAGKEFTVPKAVRPVLAGGGVVWLRHLKGEGLFLGNAEVPAVKGDGWFPLANACWLKEEPLNKLECVSTFLALGNDPEWSSLDGFHRILFASLVWQLNQGEEKERNRLIAKQRAEDVRLDISLRLLSAPLRQKGESLVSAVADVDDPLLAACQSIGAVQGIAFKPNPEMIRGVAAKDPVAAIARSSNVRFRRVAMLTGCWKLESGPLLAFRESDHRPMALLPRGKRYVAYDPVDDTRSKITEDFVSTLEPFAYTFYRAFPPEKITWKQLALFGLRGGWSEVWMILLMGVLSGLLGMATPILMGAVFDTIIPGAQRRALLEMAVFLGSSSLASVMFQLTRSFATLRLEGKMEAVVQAAVWDRLLSLPVPFFRKFSAGDLAMRGLSVTTMRQILTGSAMSSIFSGIFSVFNFGLLFYYSPKMAILAVALTFLALLVTLLCGWLQIAQQREMTELGGKTTGMVLEFIMGIAKFRVSGTESRAFMSWAAQFARQKFLSIKSRKINNWMSVFNATFPLLSSLCIFYYMAHLMSQPDAKTLTTGEFLAFNSAYGQFASAMLQLTSVFVTLVGIVPLYERAKPILDAIPEVDASKVPAGELTGRVEISHVSFSYKEDGPLILKDVNVMIQPGEFVAFVGPSGSGKSTILRILLGFETPQTGAVYFDGQELSSLDVQSVRQQMGVVMQNASVFSGSIYSNIICAAPYTMDEASEAARLAGFEKDLQYMPMGMHTVIGDGGSGLSGGQRQRLMIARAIIGKPRILLFDEATSALDNQTQAIVSKSLDELKATRIVIAHRLSTIVNADRIFVIEKGVVVQQGTYNELMREEGLFAELAKRQIT